MPNQDELEDELASAKRVVQFLDHARSDVTLALRWALETLKTYKDQMPKDEALARAFHRAERAAENSERIGDAMIRGYGPSA